MKTGGMFIIYFLSVFCPLVLALTKAIDIAKASGFEGWDLAFMLFWGSIFVLQIFSFVQWRLNELF